MVVELENLLLAHRVDVLFLDAGELARHTVVHILRGALRKLPVAVLQRVLVNPHTRRQLVAAEIIDHVLEYLLLGVCLQWSVLLRFGYRQLAFRLRLYLAGKVLNGLGARLQ